MNKDDENAKAMAMAKAEAIKSLKDFQAEVQAAADRFSRSSYAKVVEAEMGKAIEASSYDTFALGFVSGSSTAISVMMAALSRTPLDEKSRAGINRAFHLMTGYLMSVEPAAALGHVVAKAEQAKLIAEAVRRNAPFCEDKPQTSETCEDKPQARETCEGNAQAGKTCEMTSGDSGQASSPEGQLP